VSPLQRAAARRGIKPPSETTLRRYGLTADDWLGLLKAQGWRCPICERGAAALKLNTDHDHVPRWKYLKPEERRLYVRGVLCAYCNFRRVHSRMSALEARRIADYLAAYEKRSRV
jgi:hypothetical protein